MKRTLLLAAAMTALSGSTNMAIAADGIVQSDVTASYTLYVGGLLIGTGDIKARFDGPRYHVTTSMATAGAVARFYPATFKLSSSGRIETNKAEPRQFVSDSKSKRETRIITMSYGPSHYPAVAATPAFEDDDLDEQKEITPEMIRNTIDPVSAFLLPAQKSESPCTGTALVYDGKRRYNLTFAYQGEKRMTVPNATAPEAAPVARNAIVCTVTYDAIAPASMKRRSEKAARRKDDMRIWYAPFDQGRLYMPLRFELRTPIGMAVMELHTLTESLQEADAAPQKNLTKN